MNLSTEDNRSALANAVAHLEEGANEVLKVVGTIRENFDADGKVAMTADEITFVSALIGALAQVQNANEIIEGLRGSLEEE